MPEVDGLALLSQLGEHSRGTLAFHVPAVLMSSDLTAERAAAARAAGAVEVLDKPIDVSRLRTVVEWLTSLALPSPYPAPRTS